MLSTYKYYRKITIDSTNIDSDLSHFPLPVPIGTAVGMSDQDVSDIFDEVGSDYLKLAVTQADGETQLYVEVEQWDSTNEKGLLWVSSSTWSIASAADTEIYLYFDSTAADNTTYVGTSGNRTEVWNSSYGAHYGMGQSQDSTVNGYNLTANGSVVIGNIIDDLLGKSTSFAGGSDDCSIAVDCGQEWFPANLSWAFALRFKITDLTAQKHYLFGSQYNVSGYDRDLFAIRVLFDGTLSFLVDHEDEGQQQIDSSAGVIDENSSFRVFVTYDASTTTGYLYLNGSLLNSGSITHLPDDRLADTTRIGAVRQEGGSGDSGRTGTTIGEISDVQVITDKDVISDWIKADYHAQTDNLLTWGTTEQATISTNSPTNIASDSATLNGTLGDLQGESSLDVYFEYGTDTSYGSTTPIQTISSVPTSFNANITGLTAFTTYHYRAVATDGVETWFGNTLSFVAADVTYVEDEGSELETGTLTDVEVVDGSLQLSQSNLLAGYVSEQSSSESGNTGGSGYNDTGGECEPCSGLMTFEQALDYAHSQGGRLPTYDEMLNNATQGTGCSYDFEICWTCTKGGDSTEHYCMEGDDGVGITIRSNTSTAYVRWVSDDDVDRADPVELDDEFISNWLINTSYGANCGYGYKTSGNRITPSTDVSDILSIEESLIQWTSTEPTDTSLTIESSISTDGGSTWDVWQTCTDGGPMPGLGDLSDLTNTYVRFKQSLSTTDTSVTPALEAFEFYIAEELAKAYTQFFQFSF